MNEAVALLAIVLILAEFLGVHKEV